MLDWTKIEGLDICDASLLKILKRGVFSRGPIEISYAIFTPENAKYQVLLLTGWDESYLKYGEVIKKLVDAGCVVYTMDHRGQGLSSRETEDEQMTYVASFDDYVNDVIFFVTSILAVSVNINVVAHSMGGLIASILAIKAPHLVKRLVLSSPMFLMKMGMPFWLGLVVSRIGCSLGLSKMYAPGQGKVDPIAPLKKKLTRNPVKMDALYYLRAKVPAVAKGGMSFGWVNATLHAQKWFRQNMRYVTCPVLLIHGEDDDFIYNYAFEDFYKAAPNCRKVFYKGTCHEVLMELDLPRKDAISALIYHITADVPLPAEKVTVTLAELPKRSLVKPLASLFIFAAAAAVLAFTFRNSGLRYEDLVGKRIR